jgi:hypothetical protein
MCAQCWRSVALRPDVGVGVVRTREGCSAIDRAEDGQTPRIVGRCRFEPDLAVCSPRWSSSDGRKVGVHVTSRYYIIL